MILDSTLRSLQVFYETTKTTTEPDFAAFWSDTASGSSFVPGTTTAATNGSTPVTLVPAPAAATQRQVKDILVYNGDSVSHTFTIQYNDNGTPRILKVAVVPSGETLFYSPDSGWKVGTSVNVGTVTSVALAAPVEFTVSGSPVTSSGTLTFTKANETANTVWAGPTTGSPAVPIFRSLVAADIPGGFSGFANPSGLIGLTAVNGAATTADRSDSTHALDQSISPTWSGNHTFSNQIVLANGSATTPSWAVNTNYGMYYDSGNTALGVTVAGTEIGFFANSGLTTFVAGGSGSLIRIAGEGSVNNQCYQYSNNALGPNYLVLKGRGTLASSASIQLGDQFGTFSFRGLYATGSAFPTNSNAQGATITGSCIETGTPSATAMGGRLLFSTSPIGSATPTEVMRLESSAGLSMFGANPVIDQNRTVIPNSSTVSGLPAVVLGGLRNVSDLEGGQGTVFGGTSNWRNIQNGQIAQNTVDGAGVLSRFTGFCDVTYRGVVNTTMQKLKDAGLLSGKLGGLWVQAVPTNATDALLNWITPGTRNLTSVGSPVFTANQGLTGDGATAYLVAGSVAAFGGSNNNVSVGVFVRTASAAAAAVIGMGAAVARIYYLQSFTSGALNARWESAVTDTYTPARYTGQFTMARALSTNYQISLDDGAQTTITRNSSGNVTNSLSFLGTIDTTASEFSTAQISYCFVGGSVNLTASDIINLRAIMEDYYLVQVGAFTATVGNLPPAANFGGQNYYVPDLGGGAALIESDSTNWFRTGYHGYEARSLATGSETLTYLTNASNVEYTANLTGNTTVTLSGTDAKGTTVKKGAEFLITLDQAAPGAFTFAIKDGPSTNTLITFGSATNKNARFCFNGTNWRLMQDSAL